MSLAIESHGAVLQMATGTGSPATITGVTLGAITELLAVAHGFAVGDVVTFAAIVGTTELNAQTSMIIAKEDDAMFFKIDSSTYTAYESGGTATPETYTSISEVNDWAGPGGSAAVIDVTHLLSTAKEKRMGVMDEGQYTFALNRIFGDTGQDALETARAARNLKGWKLTYSDTTYQTWNGYVLAFSTSGAVDGKVAGSVTIEITGAVATT